MQCRKLSRMLAALAVWSTTCCLHSLQKYHCSLLWLAMLPGWETRLSEGWNRSLAASVKGCAGALQTKDEDHVAKHETAEECADIFKRLLKKAQKAQEGHPMWCDRDLYITHDNASFYTAAVLPEGEGEVYHLIQMPPNSPDCHKIIEHPIHPIKARFRHAFTQLKGRVAHTRSMELLVECLKESVNIESIQKDILTLNDTFHSIIRNGGDWADKGLR